MKKIFVWLLAALFMTVSCDIYPAAEETQPSDPFADVPEVNTTIAQLKALYTKPGQPVVITDDLVIGGQVISSDESGNIYRSFYIQDETGGIDLYLPAADTSVALGDTLIGQGNRAVYRGLPELADVVIEKSEGLTLTAKETTIGALTAADVCTYVQVKNLEVTEVYDNNGQFTNPNIKLADESGASIQLYRAVVNKTDGAWDLKTGDKVNVKAAVGINNTTLQLRNTLAEEIEKRGIQDKIMLKKGVIGSERWSDAKRNYIAKELGIELYDIYGLTEIYGPGIGINCKYDTGMHYWDDYLYLEIIDPATGKNVPDGEWGEIVITTLVKEGAPLIRFRTHDLSRIIPGECPCGSKFPRIDVITGRSDDMMKIKGVNVFPKQIEEILGTFPELSSEYQIRISHLDGKDSMRIYVEASGSNDFKALQQQVAAAVKSKIGFTPIVYVVELGFLPRSEKKSKRVIDERFN